MTAPRTGTTAGVRWEATACDATGCVRIETTHGDDIHHVSLNEAPAVIAALQAAVAAQGDTKEAAQSEAIEQYKRELDALGPIIGWRVSARRDGANPNRWHLYSDEGAGLATNTRLNAKVYPTRDEAVRGLRKWREHTSQRIHSFRLHPVRGEAK